MKKIKYILLGIISTFISFSSVESKELKLIADDNVQTSIAVNEVSYNPTGPANFYLGDEMDSISSKGFSISKCNRNIIASGNEIFKEEFIERINVEDSNYQNVMSDLEHLTLAQNNVNVFKSLESTLRIAVSYTNHTLSMLRELSRISNTNYNVPAILLNDSLIATFNVTPSRIYLNFENNILETNNVNQYYSVNSQGTEDRVGWGNTFFDFTLKAKTFERINSVTTLHYSEHLIESGGSININDDHYSKLDSSKGSDCIQIFEFGVYTTQYVQNLPVDVTYFDYKNGNLALGNFISHTEFGQFENTHYLLGYEIEIWLDLDEDGTYEYTPVEFKLMTETEYQDIYSNHALDEESKRSALVNKFVLAPRSPRGDEIGVSAGGLIYDYYVPYLKYEIKDNSLIKFTQLTIGDYFDYSTVYSESGIDSSFTYSLKYSGGLNFKYYVETVVGVGTFEMVGVNLSSINVSELHFDWYMHILFPLVLGTLTYIVNYSSISDNANNNIQRFYFNCYGSDNQKLDNLTKLQFKYQKGHQNVLKDVNEDGTITSYYYDDPPIQTMTIDLSKGESFNHVDFTVGEYVTQKSGFFVIDEDDERAVVGDRKYSYFYQNVYETNDYSDYMNYWDILSYWYVTTEGTTERYITNEDGYYLTTFEGEEIVMDMETMEPADITVDDFLTAETTGTNYGHEDGEKSDTGQFWEDLQNDINNWFKTIGDFFLQAGKVLLIVLGVVLGVGIIGLIIYLVIKILNYATVAKATSGRVYNVSKKPKKRKRKKGGRY